MIRTKPATIVVITLAILAPLINGCKKGEDDPFFTFRTIKNRVEGEWKIKTSSASYSLFSHQMGSYYDYTSVGDSSINLANNALKVISHHTATTTFDYGNNDQYIGEVDRECNGIVTYRVVFGKDGTS